MKRSTGIAVVLTAAVLVAAGRLPRLPEIGVPSFREWFATPAAPAGHRNVTPVRPAARPAFRLPLSRPRVVMPAIPAPGPRALAAAGALAGFGLVVALAFARRDARGRVWRLARRGFTPAHIAPRTRVPQDAVRTLLTPGVGSRR
jgi:hypothetical protein